MKRVLIVTYYWPPTGGSGVQRWVKFAKYLPKLGWQPVIYTPENPEQLAIDESLLSEVPSEAEVIRTPIHEPYEVYRKLMKHSKGGADEVNPINSGKKSLKKRLAIFARGNLFIPDPRVSWVRPSVKYLKAYLKEHPVDVMVTTGPPQSMHLIGLGLKKELGIKWVADFRDAWTKMFYFKHLSLTRLARKRHESLERQVLRSCDLAISVSPLEMKDFEAIGGRKMTLLTNGFDPSDFSADAKPDTEHFVVAQTGLFAADGNTRNIWDALAAKCNADPLFREKLRIRLAGKIDREVTEYIVSCGLEANLENLGYLPHQRTVELQRSANILILPLRREEEYAKALPGKTFEYLASGRPVLGIGQEYSAAATVLADSGAGKMYDWSRTGEVAGYIDNIWQHYLKGEPSEAGSNISKYSRESLTADLANILNDITR